MGKWREYAYNMVTKVKKQLQCGIFEHEFEKKIVIHRISRKCGKRN